ncbi:MAG: NUDIX hydrolase [Ktedonobacteraceae bacterium]
MPASLLYTICFCMRGDLVLMLFRHKPPNAHLWNGLGGKFQPGETPLACVQREIMEEATIDLHLAERLRFTGIVTWGTGHDPGNASTGMYAFVAHFPPTFPIWQQERITPEGLLCWQPSPRSAIRKIPPLYRTSPISCPACSPSKNHTNIIATTVKSVCMVFRWLSILADET